MTVLATETAETVAERTHPPADDDRTTRRRLTIDVTWATVAKLVAGLLVLAFIGDLAGRMRDIFVWILAAAFLAVALNPVVEKLEPRLGRRPAATVVFLGFTIGFLACSRHSWRRS